MTDRASIQLTASKRAPPKGRHIPDRPPNGYHVTESEPITSELSSQNHREEIERAIAEIERLDRELMILDETISKHQEILADPNTDGWDRLDAEQIIDPLLEQRSVLHWQVMQRAGDIATHGVYLVGDWRDYDLDAIGRALVQDDGVLARVMTECPGFATHPTWARLEVAACPF